MSLTSFRPLKGWLSVCGVWIVLTIGAALAQSQLIPTPEFSQHPIPTSTLSPADHFAWEYLDVAALVLALSLSSYFALVTRSRRQLLILTIASLLWFGFWRKGCVCSIGATQNVALAIADATYVIPVAVVLFFVLPLAFTLFFGRTFCAAVCPLGAVQELVAVGNLPVPRWLDHAMGLVAYVYLGFAVILASEGTAFVICRYDPFVAFFRFSGNANMLIFGGCLLVIGIFVGRPYCRYLCPYGAILRILSPLAKWHVRIPPTECIECRLCEDACPYGAIQTPTVEQSGDQRSQGKRRLLWLLIAAPLLIGIFTWLGTLTAFPLARWHREVRLAEQVRGEELGLISTPTDASDVFQRSGRPPEELYDVALVRIDRFRSLGGRLGAWVGVVLSCGLISLGIRRRRDEYTPDRSGCVSCARCFWHCPVEQERLGSPVQQVPAGDVSQAVPRSDR